MVGITFLFAVLTSCQRQIVSETSTGSAHDPSAHGARPCVTEGEEFLVKSEMACSEGLVGVSARDVPRDDYTQDDYPRGCGPKDGVPPDVHVCVACGDGECGRAEQFCNCPADCEFGEAGPTP